nr:prostaglandin E synthase 2-like [Lytechinus pictus]
MGTASTRQGILFNMAAPMRYTTVRSALHFGRSFPQNTTKFHGNNFIKTRLFSQQNRFTFIKSNRGSIMKSLSAVSGLICGAYIGQRWMTTGESRQTWGLLSPIAKQRGQVWDGEKCTDEPQLLNRKPRMLSAEDSAKMNLTLYQYQVCPFCCKVRAYLDYFGVPYTIVEVNPVFRKEIKFSEYRKVPILVQSSPGKEDIQLNDSSVIISILTSFMVTKEKDLSRLISYYPKMTYTNEKGKEVSEFTNRFNIMLLETPGLSKAEKAEMKWRRWVDEVLVHYLPPNIYRSPSESLQAFSYISSLGNFNAVEKVIMKYVGAAGMYFVAMKLKRKYNVKPDARESLYDAANEWMSVVGKKDFMGGDKPNLADLSVYGVLSSIEGLDAFNDMCRMTKIGPWYQRTKQAVESHAGAH